MFNPFEKFEPRFIHAFIKAGDVYLVSQTFIRAKNPLLEDDKIHILMTQYEDKQRAGIHLKAIKGDQYAAILDLNNEIHQDKLVSMLQPLSKYQVWSSLIKTREEVEKRMNLKFKPNIRRWIANNTTWRIGGDKEITPAIEIVFGEIFIRLKYAGQTRTVKFDEIEKS